MASSSSAQKAPATPREPDSAYHDDSFDEPNAPLLNPAHDDDDSKPVLNLPFSVCGILRLLTIPLSLMCASVLIATRRNAAGCLIFSFCFVAAAIWNTTWVLAYMGKGKKPGNTSPRRYGIAGWNVTLERKPWTGRRKLLSMDTFFDVLLWCLLLPAVVVPPATHSYGYFYWGEHSVRQEILLACGIQVLVFHALAMALSCFSLFRKARICLLYGETETEKTGQPSVQLPEERGLSIRA